jgi:hypothetical protein
MACPVHAGPDQSTEDAIQRVQLKTPALTAARGSSALS